MISDAPEIKSVDISNNPPAQSSSVTITCDLKDPGLPAPQLMWYHNGKEMVHNTNTTHFTIHSVTIQNTGIYTCLAKNYLGMAVSSAVMTLKNNTGDDFQYYDHFRELAHTNFCTNLAVIGAILVVIIVLSIITIIGLILGIHHFTSK